ncbi:MAG: hypothetical protein HON68_03140 [Gammaproteobacteria bacterium]|jgi:predicted DNA-binding transcriptional regulator AlpA|nr:hypothetical protein [Gammaproteobacteria bacterium]MBT4132010.1 hypothetical protein [Candidatus Neomarinimicrobiota bacterium]MBT4330811.1 hypothetical protein [Gammaproteobacteria bacterium]MBT4788107.1 hypothetical protein [Gammaproteobacteria bacterium]MBT5370714.1 hypothetical protein [Gammaproteobacteria bacterium]
MKKDVSINKPHPSGWANAEASANHLDLARSSFFALVADGTLPPPTKLGKRSRWRITDLDAAMLALGEKEAAA